MHVCKPTLAQDWPSLGLCMVMCKVLHVILCEGAGGGNDSW